MAKIDSITITYDNGNQMYLSVRDLLRLPELNIIQLEDFLEFVKDYMVARENYLVGRRGKI